MSYLFGIFIFIFGSAIGSFLNVVICRLESEEKLINSRSHCPDCGQVLAWYDLIPVVSFLILLGRCRYCGKKISWQYPLVEVTTGLLFVAIAQYCVILNASEGSGAMTTGFFASLRMTNYTNLFYYLFIVCSLIIIFVYDLRHYIIPDKIVFPAIGAAFLWHSFLSLEIVHWSLFAPSAVEGIIGHFSPYLLSALGASAFFLALVFITRGRGMGLGDVKLAFLMGLVLGWPDILAALFLAFFSGAIVGIILIVLGRKKMRSEIPFGPFLVVATLLIIFIGKSVIGWYLNFFGL